jgi:hypothetical protein
MWVISSEQGPSYQDRNHPVNLDHMVTIRLLDAHSVPSIVFDLANPKLVHKDSPPREHWKYSSKAAAQKDYERICKKITATPKNTKK